MILLLFTSSYPYDYAAEYPFVQPELEHLLERFEKIVLVPRVCKGKKFSLPARVEVDEQYAAFLSANLGPVNTIGETLRSKIFYTEVQRNKTLALHPVKFLKLFIFSSNAELTRRWTANWIEQHAIEESRVILYSYWFNHMATGLALVKREHPAIKVVSRAHGYDIYEEYYPPHYWPYRCETLQALDKLFLASEASRQYFCDHYPDYVAKYETAHLGIKDPGFSTRPSADDVFRIVSCSNIIFVKRLDLLLEGLAVMARMRPHQKFEWIHFGDGKGRQALQKKMERKFSSNIQGRLMGYVPNAEVIRHYQNHPCDVFLNVSETEGGAPVSIQEASSCGIPIVATAVGGIPEIVSERNGILLAPDTTPEEIAASLLRIRDDPARTGEMRKESRRVWQAGYNADDNFRAFAERLKAIGES